MFLAMALGLLLDGPDPLPPKPHNYIWAYQVLHAEPKTPVEMDEEKRLAVYYVAIDLEIMDQRECRYMIYLGDDVLHGVDYLRSRIGKYKDAPKAAEAEKFCNLTREEIQARISFNRNYKTYLEVRLAWEPELAGPLNEALRETEQLYRLWDAIRDSKSDMYYITVRRDALLRIRNAIGNDAFDRGERPPHVPYWRFSDAANR